MLHITPCSIKSQLTHWQLLIDWQRLQRQQDVHAKINVPDKICSILYGIVRDLSANEPFNIHGVVRQRLFLDSNSDILPKPNQRSQADKGADEP